MSQSTTPKIGWVVLSDADRAAAERNLAANASEGTRDELGFGAIHFAYADRFFPGTSVLQTRLRYVWFIAGLIRNCFKPGGHPRFLLKQCAVSKPAPGESYYAALAISRIWDNRLDPIQRKSGARHDAKSHLLERVEAMGSATTSGRNWKAPPVKRSFMRVGQI